MKKIRPSLFAVMLLFWFGLSNAQYNNSSMNGAWFIVDEIEMGDSIGVYGMFDGNGNVTEIGIRDGNQYTGTYSITSVGIVTGSLAGGVIILNGRMTSATSARIHISVAGDTLDFVKITNEGKAQGIWSGEVTIQNPTPDNPVSISLTVNQNGEVTGATGLAAPVTGKVFIQSNAFFGHLYTNDNSGWSQVSLSGKTVSPDSVTFTVELDSSDGAGTLSRPTTVGIQSPNMYVSSVRSYPNPFDNQFIIEYTLEKNADVLVNVFDNTGKMIKTLFRGIQQTGIYQLNWNGTDEYGIESPNGYYSYWIVTDGMVIAKDKMLRMR